MFIAPVPGAYMTFEKVTNNVLCGQRTKPGEGTLRRTLSTPGSRFFELRAEMKLNS